MPIVVTTETISPIPTPIFVSPEPISPIPTNIVVTPETITPIPTPIVVAPEPISPIPSPIVVAPQPISPIPTPIVVVPEPILPLKIEKSKPIVHQIKPVVDKTEKETSDESSFDHVTGFKLPKETKKNQKENQIEPKPKDSNSKS